MAGTWGDEQWASVVIPAHNEENALPRLLESVLQQELRRLHLEVIVVVNGSTDGTAAAARAYVAGFVARGHHLQIMEISTASKACALNEGDRNVTSFPRLYLDADILLSPNAIWRTVEELGRRETPLLAAPRIHIADSANRAVRSYARVWSRLPYIRSRVPGVGFYAVNETGRRRWWRFPTRMGADDKFVRLHFLSDETLAIDDAFFVMFFPERLAELFRVRGRWISLNREIARHCPRLHRGDDSRWRSSLRHVATNVSIWPDVPAFLAVWSGGWALSLLRTAGIGQRWSRATSSPIRTTGRFEAPALASVEPSARPELVKTLGRKRSLHVVVVTYNSAAVAPRCIESLLGSRGIDEIRVTIVDNASVDGCPETLTKMFPHIKVIANDHNLGFAAAVNRGFRHTTGRWLAIVNPDVEVRPETFAACITHLEENIDTGCCGVPAIHADGTVNDRSFFMRPTVWSEIALSLATQQIAPASRFLNPEQYLAHRSSKAPLEIDILAGCFTIVDQELFQHLGGFDERYFLCGEDFDFSARAMEAGAAPTVLSVQPILHQSEGSFETRADARVAYLRGRAQYQCRWWSTRGAAVASAIRASAILARLAALWTLRSTRVQEFKTIWACRDQWGGAGYSNSGRVQGPILNPPHANP
jgi:N-acetylglucosaminyl-diphospho-decaprenol L-rhamnosyltransferase